VAQPAVGRWNCLCGQLHRVLGKDVFVLLTVRSVYSGRPVPRGSGGSERSVLVGQERQSE